MRYLRKTFCQRVERQRFRIAQFRKIPRRYQEAEVVNAPIRSQQYQQHPQTAINEEVRLLDVEMNPPSLIEGSGADMNPGEPLGAQVVHEEGSPDRGVHGLPQR